MSSGGPGVAARKGGPRSCQWCGAAGGKPVPDQNSGGERRGREGGFRDLKLKVPAFSIRGNR